METPDYLKFAEKVADNGYAEIWQDHNFFYVARKGDLLHLTDFSIRQHGETTAHLLASTFMNAYKEGYNAGVNEYTNALGNK